MEAFFTQWRFWNMIHMYCSTDNVNTTNDLIFKKIGAHFDVCEQISFKLGFITNTTNLYVLTLAGVPLTLILRPQTREKATSFTPVTSQSSHSIWT